MTWRGLSPTFAPLFAALPVFVVYLFTLAPSLTWAHAGADGGDLMAAIARGGLPHPPGFPTYLLCGELFIRLPWGEPAWRLNLLSAVAAASAVGLVAATVQTRGGTVGAKSATDCHCERSEAISKPLGDCFGAKTAPRNDRAVLALPINRLCTSHARGGRLLAAVVAGLSMGLVPLLWSQAVIAEVYALAVGCAALVTYLVCRDGPVWLTGFVWGIGLGAHPVIAFYALLVAWGAWENRAARAVRLVQAALGALVGGGVMYGLVIVARGSVPSPWGEVNSLADWWAYISAQMYHGYLFGLPLGALPPRIFAWLGILSRQFTPMGAVIVLWGYVELWRSQRALAIVTLCVVIATSIFAITYNTTDSIVYLSLALPVAVLWLAEGLARVAVWLRQRWQFAGALVLLLPLLQLALFWHENDLRAERAAMDWVERVQRDAPARAILVTAQDRHTFALWYVHDVLGKRPDIVVIDRDLWEWEAYRDMLTQSLGVAAPSLEELGRATGRPLVDVGD